MFCFNPRAHAGRDPYEDMLFTIPDCFNPRAHAGRDEKTPPISSNRCLFQSTRPRRARHRNVSNRIGIILFQSTRPRRARQKHLEKQFKPGMFQSTRPRRARQPSAGLAVSHFLFQSTRPRRARQARKVTLFGCVKFQSTRPRRARRKSIQYNLPELRVSIHAPTQGATRIEVSYASLSICFNPRAHAGRDIKNVLSRKIFNVSIHAPTQGATEAQTLDVDYMRQFQSTRPRRARLSWLQHY